MTSNFLASADGGKTLSHDYLSSYFSIIIRWENHHESHADHVFKNYALLTRVGPSVLSYVCLSSVCLYKCPSVQVSCQQL